MFEYKKISSPNFWAGRKGYKPEIFIIHKCEGNAAGCVAWVVKAEAQVSYNYIITPAGDIVEVVSPDNAAWHAGKISNPSWKYLKIGVNPNLYSIGISLSGFSTIQHSEEQFFALVKLLMFMSAKYIIPIDEAHLAYHSEIADYKKDPGPFLPKSKIFAATRLLNFTI